MSGFLFIVVVDWIMRNTNISRRGIRWQLTSVLEDLDYADDLALISSRFRDIQDKTSRLNEVAKYTGLNINVKKTKALRVNCKVNTPLKIGDEDVEDVNQFTYLGAILDKTGGTAQDIHRRLGLARAAFAKLQPIWRASRYSKRTKVKIFTSNVTAILLYGSETWRMTITDEEKLGTFQRKCLRKILKIF